MANRIQTQLLIPLVAIGLGSIVTSTQAKPDQSGRAIVPAPLTSAEMKTLREVERDFARYKSEAQKHHQRMRQLLMREFKSRESALKKRYTTRIARTETVKRQRHLEAIALLERFIQEHPSHPQFTPDAMFRLADLHLDEADLELEAREEAGDLESLADYSKSLELWQKILDKFPKYRQTAGTLYLLAYYGQTKDERQSLQLFLSLVCANKYKPGGRPPRTITPEQARQRYARRELLRPYFDCQPWPGADEELIRHAWIRGVADHHFATPGELDEAISAYLLVANNEKAFLYEEAVYKLAWSYYRRDFLLQAAQRFDQSVIRYDKLIAEGKEPRLHLREEALQYIAVSFTDPWQGEADTDPVKALERARKFYEGREKEPHVRDVWVTIGTAFSDLQAHDQAIDAFRKAIGKPWHLHPENPVVHQRIIDAYEGKGDDYAANEAAAELATRYAVGTPWYVANEKNREAMQNQASIGERLLFGAARNMHKSATDSRKAYEEDGANDPELKKEYLEMYAKAAQLYRNFLRQYPESKATYEFTYGLAEVLFFSGKYVRKGEQEGAVEHYRWVRDHRNLGESLFKDAAKSVIQSYEAEVAAQVKAGQLTELKVPDADALKSLSQPIRSKPIPPIYQKLRQAYDEYQKLVDDQTTAPKMGLNAALVSFAYLHLDDALKRFEVVLGRFCGNDAAERAKDGMLAIYQARNQKEKFRNANNRFIKSKCGNAAAIRNAIVLNRSMALKEANELFAAGKHNKAGDTYYKYYKSAQQDDENRPVALYNAAIAYREAGKPKTAIHLFQEFTKNTSKPFRESEYYLVALRQTAESYQSKYDYKSAVSVHLEIYRITRNPRAGLKPPPPLPGQKKKSFRELRVEALYNAASLRELDRDFDRAVKLYREYAKDPASGTREKDRALWSVARIYQTAGKLRATNNAYKEWRSRYGRNPGNEDDYVASYYNLAKLAARVGRSSDARRFRKETITAWERSGKKRGSKGAEMAGEFALAEAEAFYQSRWEKFAIKKKARNEKQAKQLIKSLESVRNATQDKYEIYDKSGNVVGGLFHKYGVPELLMASKVRIGDTAMGYSQKLYAMPIPRYIESLAAGNPDVDIMAQYEEALGKRLETYVQAAKQNWAAVIKAGKDAGVHNKWVELARENLNREFPDEFPILHQALVEGTEAP